MTQNKQRRIVLLAAALGTVWTLAWFSAEAGARQAAAPQTSEAISAAALSLCQTIESIQKAQVVTRILFITAHPDDEWGSLLAYLSRGAHADVALLTVTRGQGGQNAIGQEQDGELGVLRTTELLRADSFYGVKQFFTRAVDSGFSKSPERTMKEWGNLPLEDMTRAIRTFRPQVVINGWGGVHWGHGQHQATGVIVPQAIVAAADPHAFPDQIAEGLAPWKVTLELRGARGTFGGAAGANAVEIPVNGVSPVWGQSYSQIGVEGHSQHVSQGTPGFYGAGFLSRPLYLETENGEQAGGKFDPALLDEPISSLGAKYHLDSGKLQQIEADLQSAQESAQKLDRTAAAESLAHAAQLAGELRRGAGRSEAGWELEAVQERIERALSEDIALPLGANADRHELVAGDSFTVTVNTGSPAVPVKFSLDSAQLELPRDWTASAPQASGPGAARFSVDLPADAKPQESPADPVLPFPPPLVTLRLPVEVAGYGFAIEQPVQSEVPTTTGTIIYPLSLVPAVTITPEQQQIMIPASRAAQPIESMARVRYHGANPARVTIGVDAPAGWKVAAISPLDFPGAGDQLIRFTIAPSAGAATGAYELHPYASLGSQTFRTALEPIPSLPTHNWSEPDDVTIHLLDLKMPRALRIGYIAAENDPLPDSLRQLGIRVDMLGEADLAFDDLSQYDAIVAGIRAYELRPDLGRMNWRLLDYARHGGSLVVQYQRLSGWTKYLPFPAHVSESSTRVTDAHSPVRFLDPQNPLLNSANKITMADFEGWVQERGLYFWGSLGAPYQPVLGLSDPGEAETTGSLIYARDGKGVWIYTGLSFFRELPAGVPGAYRLFVNLLSQTPRRAAGD